MVQNESKREKFVRLAESRTQKAVDAIENIKSLSDPRNYDFDDKDIVKIIRALKEAVSIVENSFKAREKKTFTLS